MTKLTITLDEWARTMEKLPAPDIHFTDGLRYTFHSSKLFEARAAAIIDEFSRAVTRKPSLLLEEALREFVRLTARKVVKGVVKQVVRETTRNREHRWDGHHRPAEVLEYRQWQQKQAAAGRAAMAQKHRRHSWAEQTAEAGW